MNLTIDTENKTVEVHGEEKICDIINQMKELFPKDKWKEYSLSMGFSSKITIDDGFGVKTVPFVDCVGTPLGQMDTITCEQVHYGADERHIEN